MCLVLPLCVVGNQTLCGEIILHGRPLCQDSLAEWSKALAQGASPQGNGLEPHSCHGARTVGRMKVGPSCSSCSAWSSALFQARTASVSVTDMSIVTKVSLSAMVTKAARMTHGRACCSQRTLFSWYSRRSDMRKCCTGYCARHPKAHEVCCRLRPRGRLTCYIQKRACKKFSSWEQHRVALAKLYKYERAPASRSVPIV